MTDWIHVPARETFEGQRHRHDRIGDSAPFRCARCKAEFTGLTDWCPGRLVSVSALLVASEAVTQDEYKGEEAHINEGCSEYCEGREPITGLKDYEIEEYCTWRYEQDSEPCGECGGSGRCDQHPVDDCECDPCRGSGRVLLIDCPACSGHGKLTHAGDGFLRCEPCDGLGSFPILSYRPATQAECAAARRPCEECGGSSPRNITVPPGPCICRGTGYTDPPYDSAQLRLVAVLA